MITSHDYLDRPDLTLYECTPVHRFPFRKALRSGDPRQLREARHRVAPVKRILKPDLIHVNAVGPSVLFHLQTMDAHRAPSVVRVNQEILSEVGAGPNTLIEKSSFGCRLGRLRIRKTTRTSARTGLYDYETS